MHFRKSTPDDIDCIMDILTHGRRAIAALGIDQWQGGYPHRDVVEQDVARNESYVVEDEGSVIATVMIGFSGEACYDFIAGGKWLTPGDSRDPRYAVLHRVAVGAHSQGKGVATFLLKEAECLVREQDFASVRIDTHPGNTPMRRLLEKCGYTSCGTIFIAHAEGASPDRTAYEKLV